MTPVRIDVIDVQAPEKIAMMERQMSHGESHLLVSKVTIVSSSGAPVATQRYVSAELLAVLTTHLNELRGSVGLELQTLKSLELAVDTYRASHNDAVLSRVQRRLDELQHHQEISMRSIAACRVVLQTLRTPVAPPSDTPLT